MKLRLRYFFNGEVFDSSSYEHDDWSWSWINHMVKKEPSTIWFFTTETTDIF